MGKYNPLATYLIPLPKREVCLGFAEIERVLGSPLPPTARKDRPWWANTLASNHGSIWLMAGWKVSRVDLHGEKVTFVRDGQVQEMLRQYSATKKLPVLPHARSPRRYEAFRRFLAELPADQIQVALSFDAIGAVLGGKLPRTAYHDRPWWANTKRSPQGNAWVSAGWRVDAVHLKAQTAVFRRRHEDPLRLIPRLVADLLDGKPHVGRPGADRVAAWMGFCRRIGWYFEGTVLYERIGVTGDSLSEAEQARVEEDYAVCKRELCRYQSRHNQATSPARSEEKLNGEE